jgi:hypothetical protein
MDDEDNEEDNGFVESDGEGPQWTMSKPDLEFVRVAIRN